MTNLTAKQRAKIYRKAAEFLYKYRKDVGACWSVYKTAHPRHREIYNWQDMTKREFPELMKFKPSNKPSHDFWWGVPWIESEGTEPRILALLLCEQMCLNPSAVRE